MKGRKLLRRAVFEPLMSLKELIVTYGLDVVRKGCMSPRARSTQPFLTISEPYKLE